MQVLEGQFNSWNVFGTLLPLGYQIGGNGMTKSQNSPPEIVFQLRMKHSISDQKWRVVLEGPEPNKHIRFDDLGELVQYLKAFSHTDNSRGLR
jgi:hypothetical protein